MLESACRICPFLAAVESVALFDSRLAKELEAREAC